jgi:hypothetical protein
MALDISETFPRDNSMKQRQRWAGHAASLGETRNACIILIDTYHLGDLRVDDKTILKLILK